MEQVCTGYGAHDTHALILNDGRTNTHRSAGTPYEVLSADRIYAMLVNPPTTDKNSAQWIIPSAYNQWDARTHTAQRAHGRYWWLAVDIDKGSPSLAHVDQCLRTALGDVHRILYATRSCAPGALKWRGLIPLPAPITGAQFVAYQTCLFEALEHLGLQVDWTLSRAAQLVYLPNRGEHYEHLVAGTAFLDLPAHPMTPRALSYVQSARTAEQGTQKQEGSRSYLAAFRRRHSIEEMLGLYGYVRKGDSDHWRSPYQDSNSYATKVLDASWYSLSDSDAHAGLGAPATNGGRYGDQFDLYLHFNCGGNYAQAEAYARQCLADEDARRLGAATEQHGRSVWDALCTAKARNDQAVALAAVNTIQLQQDEGNNEEWTIGWPPGLTGELAKWIYASSSRPVKQYSIAAALYFMSVTGRKYNVDGKGLNLYMMLVGGTGRGKGVVKTAVDKLVHAIVTEGEDPALANPFNYEVAVSEAGFRRGLSAQNPMCVYEEELGATLLPLTSSRASANDIGLRKVLTRLFDSGEGSKLGIKQASSADNTKEMVSMPCLTLAGDTQPHIFRGLLGNGMLDTGFSPRMVPFFYYGKRSYHNKESAAYAHPDKGLTMALRGLLQYCIRSSETVVPVQWAPGVRDLYDKLDVDYTDKINAGEVGAEMFNRAGIIVARVAGLLAVGANHMNPIIDHTCYEYARQVVWQGLRESQRILQNGGGGQGENVRLFHLREAMRDFVLMNPDTKMKTYKTPKSVVDGQIINDRYFLVRFKSNTDFAPAGGSGTTEGNIRETIEEAVRQEILEPATDVILDKRTRQKMYRIGPNF